MTERPLEAVELARVRRDATCIITRIGLGLYELQGPGENILVPESRVAWATVVHDLEGEGYRLVPPEEYAAETGMAEGEVKERLHREGSLFAVAYDDLVVLPLPEKEAVLDDIEVPGSPRAPSGARLPEADRERGRVD